ncbi:ion transporter [Algirhabdus cladophorae]|uniref:ion transporter n=1 Tax=Algirhabdus cladophorae TaxID=3377108 RepID=UPI003B847B84
MRKKLQAFLSTPQFERTILILIVINAIVLALETYPFIMDRYGPLLEAIDKAILWVFVAEVGARLALNPLAFWRDPWRVFDFLVVAIALLPATGQLSILRALRILRVLRLVSAIPSMRRVVTGLLNALPGMGSIVLLLTIIYFVFAVLTTKLFGASFPDWFGSLTKSAYTLFQIMTLESWSMGIVRPVMDVYPTAWLIFIPFLIMTAFTVLNLFIGVIVDAMQSEHEDEAREARDQMQSESALVLEEVRALRREVQDLRGLKKE